MEQTNFSNFGKGSFKEHFYEIIFKLVHWPRRRYHLKVFSIFSSGSHLVYQSGTILSILVGSQLSIIPLKSESNWPKGLGEDSIKSKLFMLFYF